MEGKWCLQVILDLSCVKEMEETFEEEAERTKEIMMVDYKDPSGRVGEGRESLVYNRECK